MLKKQSEFNKSTHLAQPSFSPFSLEEEFPTELLTATAQEGNLTPEKERPESRNSGLNADESIQTQRTKRGTYRPSIVLEKDLSASGNNHSPGTNMSAQSFIKSYHSLRKHPGFLSLTRKERELFIELLHLVVWKPTDFWVGSKKITLQPGQYCTTERDLAKYLNEKKAKTDSPYDRWSVRRTISKLFEMRFLHQDLHQRKTLLTITYSTFCENQDDEFAPRSAPILRQTCANKEDILDEIDRLISPKKSEIPDPNLDDLFATFDDNQKQAVEELSAKGFRKPELIVILSQHPLSEIKCAAKKMKRINKLAQTGIGSEIADPTAYLKKILHNDQGKTA